MAYLFILKRIAKDFYINQSSLKYVPENKNLQHEDKYIGNAKEATPNG